MKGTVPRRILLALIPVAILATASLALTGTTQQPVRVALMPTAEQAVQTADETSPHVPAAGTPSSKTVAAETGQTANPGQTAQPAQQTTEQAQPVELPPEPLPELIVDKTPLTDAMTDIDRALEQAKLAVTALDAPSQQRYIQEAINLLAGSTDAGFRPLTAGASAESYRGVRPLLIQARVMREAAEVQWIAAVQHQLDARAKKLAEIAQAGNAAGTVPPPPENTDLSSTVGPTGVLGTRGVRVEEQATELVSRAIRQATEALRLVPVRSQSSTPEGEALTQNTDQATQVMEAVVRMLESAKKIIQIAIER
jgi:hypothetical protein